MCNDHPAWRTSADNIRLRLSASSDAAKLRTPAFTVLDVLQRFPPEVQLDTLFTLAVGMAEVIGLDGHELVSRARRILPEAEGPFSEQFQAAKDYARGELRQ